MGTSLAVRNAVLLVFMVAPHAAPAATPVKIVAFGDSLTAGYELQPQEAFPAQLEAALKAKGHAVTVVNAGVSGDTTAAGLERFDWAIGDGADAVILELGANDALRGINPKETHANLEKILSALKAKNLDVLVTGMKALQNWGDAHAKAFESIFPELAAKYGALYYPFFLEGVLRDAKLNLKDGLHPNAKGVAEIVRRVLPMAEELVRRVEARKAAAAKG